MAATVKVEREGKKITLRGWIGPDTPGLCKQVGGGRFSKKPTPHWSYALDMGVCRRLREVFGDRLTIGPDLWAWAKAESAFEQELHSFKLADGADVTLTQATPAMQAAMANRTYQRTAAFWGTQVGSFLLADQPGLGKTIETLASIIETEGATTNGVLKRHLILCPKKAIGAAWEPEIARWLAGVPDVLTVALTGSGEERKADLHRALDDPWRVGHLFVIGNIEMARDQNPPRRTDKRNNITRKPDYLYPDLFEVEWDTIIVDESHRALINTSRANPTQTRWGMGHLRAKRRIALSGTPMRGKPEQLWGTLNWLRPDLYTSYWNWVGRYFEVGQGYTENSKVVGELMPGAADRMEVDHAAIMLRRTKEEVLPELPPKSYNGWHIDPTDETSPFGVWLPLEGAHRTQYRKFEADAALKFEDGEMIATGTLAEYTRRKQLANCPHKLVNGKLTPTASGPKWDWLVQKITELGIMDGEGEGKIVVASQFTGLIEVWAHALREMGVRVNELTGKTSDAAATAQILEFQVQNTTRVFLINTKAGGVAVTLDAADDLVIIDESVIPDDQEQVEDRVHRTSRTHNVTIHYLRTLETQDEEIAWIAACRQDVQRYILDGARGVEFARQFYTTTQEGNQNGPQDDPEA